MHKGFDTGTTWRGALAMAGIAIATLGVLAAEPPPPGTPAAPLLISARSLGSVGGRIDGGDFAAALEGFGISARSLTGALPPDWRTPPALMEPPPWVSIVTAGFGATAGPDDRAEAYAFLFNATDGSLNRLGHVSYQQTYDSNATAWHWIPPTARLAATVRAALARPPDHDRPLLGLRVEAGKEDPDAILLDAGLAARGDDFSHTSAFASGRPLLEAMAWAAAFEAGWAPAPRTGPEEASAVLEVYFSHRSCSLRLTLKTPSGERVSVKRNVPENRYHAHLRRMFMALHQKAFFSDFLSLQERPAADRFTSGPGPLPSQDGDRRVVGTGTNLSFFTAGKLLWQHAVPDDITCGPAILGNRVIAGTAAGELFTRDAASGKPLWHVSLEPGLAGTLAGNGDLILVFSRDSEALTAVDANNGEQRWRQPLGDVLVRTPVPTRAGLLIATKSNRVLLLDPETGNLRAERQMPAWIHDILRVDRPGGGTDGVIACLTRNGSLYLLDPADLAIRSVHALGARAGGPMLLAETFPATWPGPLRRDDLTAPIEQDTGIPPPCLLVSDEEGFAYIIPLSRLLR